MRRWIEVKKTVRPENTQTANTSKIATMSKFTQRVLMAAAGVVLTAVIAIVVIINSSSSQALTQEDALKIAQQHVPATASFLAANVEDDFEFTWIDSVSQSKYQVGMNNQGEVKNIFSERVDREAVSNVVLSEDDILSVFVLDFPDATEEKIVLVEYKDGTYEYEVLFKQGEFTGAATYNVQTGDLTSQNLNSTSNVLLSISNNSQQDLVNQELAERGLMSVDEIRTKANDLVTDGEVSHMILNEKTEVPQYEIDVIKDDTEFDIVLNAQTGEIISFKRLDNPMSSIQGEESTGGTPNGETDSNLVNGKEDDEDDGREVVAEVTKSAPETTTTTTQATQATQAPPTSTATQR